MGHKPMTRRERREAERAAEAAAAPADLRAAPAAHDAAGSPDAPSSPAVAAAPLAAWATAPSAATPDLALEDPVDPGAPRLEATPSAEAGSAVVPGADEGVPAVPLAAAHVRAEVVASARATAVAALAEEPLRAPRVSPVEEAHLAAAGHSTRHRRTGAGILARTGVLSVLALVTVIAPLSPQLATGAEARAALAAGSVSGQSSPTAVPSSVAAAVLGSDADVDSSTQLSAVPDAATLARIREAYENAAATCAAQTGASGDTSAFTTTPTLFYPMIEGTYTISSAYGYRIHPTLGVLKLHAGQDYAASVGTPIYAAAAGEVVKAGMVNGTGTVTIKHVIDGETWYTSYLHMYSDGIYVKVGDKVTAGQLIAAVGSSGRSTGAHLHFEVRTADDGEDSSTVDPQAWLKKHGGAQLTTNCS